MPLVEEIPEVVKVATSFIPALKNVKLVRGLIIPVQGTGQFNETKALEEYESAKKKNQEQRVKLKKKYNKHVIKISDAMKCVEDNVFDGAIAISVGKALMSTITSSVTGTSQNAGDILFGHISGCMIGKMLQQKNKRRRGEFSKKKPEAFSEKVRIRKGKLHPYVTP